MASIKGIKSGTTTITATYGSLTSQVNLNVLKLDGNVSYSANNLTIYCTTQAAAKTVTDSTVAKGYTISTGVSTSTSSDSGHGQNVSCAITSIKKGTTTQSSTGITLSTDGKTLTIPSGLNNGTYTIEIKATAAANDYYNAATKDVTITLAVTATSISTYGNVSAPTITQTTNVPASAITIDTSNITTYVTVGGASQTITYNNSATRNGTITYTTGTNSNGWSGSSTDLASLGTTPTGVAAATINTLTVTATGEGSKTGTATISKLNRVANVAGNWQAAFTTQPTWNDITAGGAAGAPATKGTVTIKRQYTSGDWESYTTSPTTTTYGTWSYAAGTAASAPNGFAINSSTGNCTATSLGYNAASRTQRGNAKLTFTANSSYGGSTVKATSNEVAVYQAENSAGNWSASFTTQPTWNDITAGGAAGASKKTAVVKLSRTWTSSTTPETISNIAEGSTTYGSWSYTKGTDATAPNGFAVGSSNGNCTATSLGTSSASRTQRGNAKVTFTASSTYNSASKTSNEIEVYQAANSEGTTHYKAATGTATGDNWTYGTPTAVTKVYGKDMLHTINTTVKSDALNVDAVQSSVTDTKQYYLEWTSGSRKSHTETPAGTVAFAFASQTVNGTASTTAYTLFATAPTGWKALETNQAYIQHRDLGTTVATDACSVYAYNTNDNTKKTTGTNNATWSITNERTKVLDGYKSYGSPSISIGTGLTAAGGSATITIGTVTNERYYHYTYTDTAHNESANAHYENESGSARWRITKQYIGTANNSTSGTTIERFTHPTSGSSNLTIGGTSTATYATGTKVSHSSMGTNIGFDFVEVTAYNILDTTKTATAKLSTNSAGIENKLTWSAPVITKANASLAITNDAATKAMVVTGETFTFEPVITQSGTYTSGSTASNTSATYAYEVTTTKTGYTLSSNKVTVTNNNSSSARNGFVVKITATATPTVTGTGNYTDTASVTFNQVAGAKVYNTPTVTAFSYDTFAAGGATKTPNTLAYSQVWTWNGVANSGDTLTDGGTATYSTTGTLPSGFTKASDFATTGSCTWENRATTTGNARDAKSNLKVTITMNGETSAAYTCTSCQQQANVLTWSAPTITQTTPITMNVEGQTYTFAPTLAQSGSYTSGSTATGTVTYTVAEKTAKTGYSTDTANKKVTVTNNESTSARNGYTVTITATGSKKNSSDANEVGTMIATKDVVFNQAAGAKTYDNPVIKSYTYASFGANGGTKTPNSITYEQNWYWNGVAGSGGTLTSGGTLAYTSASTLPSGFTKGSDFATTGSVTWANRTTVEGDERDAKSNLTVAVTMNGKTSAAYTCTSCAQVANAVIRLSLSLEDPAQWNSTTSKYDLYYNSTANTKVDAEYTSGSHNTNFTSATITSGNSTIASVS